MYTVGTATHTMASAPQRARASGSRATASAPTTAKRTQGTRVNRPLEGKNRVIQKLVALGPTTPKKPVRMVPMNAKL